jgi:hypothetical protein
MKSERLTEENYILYAMKNYDNPQCMGMREFQEDMARIVYLKRLFRRYKKSGVLRDRLILNHIITLYNVFGMEAATRLLFFRIEADLHDILKTFLVFLEYLPSQQPKYQVDADIIALGIDTKIADRLRRI